MATPEENKNQEELNKLLEQENKILREKLKLQSESFDISSGLVESLKETLGIRSRQTTFENNILNINKDINKTILNQKLNSLDINSIKKQISKNNDLIHKTTILESGMQQSLSDIEKEKVEYIKKKIDQQNSLNEKIQNEVKALERGEAINKKRLNGLKGNLTQVNAYLEKEIATLNPLSQQLLYTQLQRKELIKQNEERKKEEKTLKQIQDTLGVSGALIKGINKVPFLKDLPGMSSILKDIEDEIQKINELRKTEGKEPVSKAEALKMTLSKTGGVIKKNITDPFVIFSFLTTQIIDAFTSLDKGIGEFAKGMNLSYQEAANLDQQFNSIANSSGDIAVTTKGIRDTMLAMGQAMGSNAILNAKDAETFTKLREKAGLANEELVEMQKLTLATGGNLEDNVSSMLFAAKTTALNNGVLLNEKQIMKEVAKASAATKLSLAGNPEALAKAAAQAKALGMSLEQVDKIASSLLNIESSISDELEAELLTGKNLNLEQARLYALNNDMEGLSREIAKNFGSAAEFSKMNRIQQEAAAKAVGMSREELAATLTDQEALKRLSGKRAEDAKAALAAARARGMTEEEIKKQGIDGLMAQQSMQQRFNNSVEKLKEIFVSLLEPLMPIFNVFTNLLNIIGSIQPIITAIVAGVTVWYTTTKLIAGVNKTIAFLKGISLAADKNGVSVGKQMITQLSSMVGLSTTKAVAETTAATALSFGTLLPVILGAGAAIYSLISSFKTADDMVSPGYGKRTLTGPEGAIALNDKDTVIAGTNLFDKKADDAISEPGKITEFKPEGAITAPTPTSSPSIDYTALASAIVSALSKAPMSVNVKGEIDGKTLVNFIENNATVVGTAQAKGTSKIQ